ncbi:hypothetical protein ACFVWT_03565 [Arthrobacter sp. NPDC058288]|uniref:hypothetical protein n=1 Tax=Arthrobacter sp. NPDC058288 TaxID=3346424 RepID=UPI0036EED27D
MPASNAVSLVPAPDTTDGADAATTSVEAGVPSLDVWASVVLGPKPDPTRPSAPGNGKTTPPGQRTQPTPSPSPTTEPASPAPSPVPTSPAPSPAAPSPSGGTAPPSGTPAPSPTGGAAAPAPVPAAPAPATGSAPAGTPAAPPLLPGTSAPGAPATGAITPGSPADVPDPVGTARPSGSKAAGPAAAAPASAWITTNVFGPANMAILTSAGVVPLSGPGYGVSSAPVMRSAVSVSPVGELSPQVWWGAGLVALACAAGVAYVRMRRI